MPVANGLVQNRTLTGFFKLGKCSTVCFPVTLWGEELMQILTDCLIARISKDTFSRLIP